MKPISFPDQNCTFAKNQAQYLQLPAHKTQDGLVLSCWTGSLVERLRFLLTGKMWLSVMTFGTLLQPSKLSVQNPLDLARRLAERHNLNTPDDKN